MHWVEERIYNSFIAHTHSLSYYATGDPVVTARADLFFLLSSPGLGTKL